MREEVRECRMSLTQEAGRKREWRARLGCRSRVAAPGGVLSAARLLEGELGQGEDGEEGGGGVREEAALVGGDSVRGSAGPGEVRGGRAREEAALVGGDSVRGGAGGP